MSPALIILIGGVYGLVAVDLFRRGQFWLGWAFAGYAFSNVGLWQLARVGG